MLINNAAEYPADKTELYPLLCAQLKALRTGRRVTDLANGAALLAAGMPDINWAGFYLSEGDSLVLGPFQGLAACTEIAYGRGVCGTAAAKDEPQLVPDVHAFAGHIACDTASRSELVIPLHKDGAVAGVLDIDSPLTGRFTQEDSEGLTEFCRLLEESL